MMVKNSFNLLLVICFSTISFVTPVKNGRDVGHVKILNNELVITGKTDFPYVVHIKIMDKTEHSDCAGVIIGKNAVLTAGHCLHRMTKPTATIHAGIIERNLESKRGQKLQMIDYKVHEHYKHTCETGKKPCCYHLNDIAIVWTNKDFVPSPYVKRAVLNGKLEQPIGSEGWILGWGEKNNNKMATMLQKGLVKVVSNEECKQFNPDIYISKNLLCLRGVNQGTRSSVGDSGGPFVIDGKVYGISNIDIPNNACSSKTLDGYIFIAKYFDWINQNLRAGLPKKGNVVQRRKTI